jgi:hypothetical protein
VRRDRVASLRGWPHPCASGGGSTSSPAVAQHGRRGFACCIAEANANCAFRSTGAEGALPAAKRRAPYVLRLSWQGRRRLALRCQPAKIGTALASTAAYSRRVLARGDRSAYRAPDPARDVVSARPVAARRPCRLTATAALPHVARCRAAYERDRALRSPARIRSGAMISRAERLARRASRTSGSVRSIVGAAGE